MAKRDRPVDDSKLEPPPKKQRSIEPQMKFVWFNKVPSPITIHSLQQHLWSKYRLNAQPQLKTVVDSASYFYIEIAEKRGNELIKHSPIITIKGHDITLSNAYEPPLGTTTDQDDIKTMHQPNTIKYRILVSNVPSQCTERHLEQLFSQFGGILSVHCDDNMLCKTARIDFDSAQCLVKVAMKLALDSLKLEQEILEIVIDPDTKNTLYTTNQDAIISELIKLNFIKSKPSLFIKPIVTRNVLKPFKICITTPTCTNINTAEDETSIGDDNASEMSISPNLSTADIKVIDGTNAVEGDIVNNPLGNRLETVVEETVGDLEEDQGEKEEKSQKTNSILILSYTDSDTNNSDETDEIDDNNDDELLEDEEEHGNQNEISNNDVEIHTVKDNAPNDTDILARINEQVDISMLTIRERDILHEYKERFETTELEIKTLRNTMKMEDIEFDEMFTKLKQRSASAKDEPSKILVDLHGAERKLSKVLLAEQKALEIAQREVEKMQSELSNVNVQMTKHKLIEKQVEITNSKECDQWSKDRFKFQKQMDVLSKTNKKLIETIEDLQGKSKSTKHDIESAKCAKTTANALCMKYEDELKAMAEQLKENKAMVAMRELKMSNAMYLVKSNLEIEKTKHAKSKLLLKQTVNGIQENLIKINNQNKVKDNLIFGLQKQLQYYQSQYPSLMTL
eukprot:685_1